MTRKLFTTLLVGATLAAAGSFTPAMAQTDPHQPVNDGSAGASMTVPPGQVAPGADPGTMSANAGVNGAIAANQMNNAANQSQYAIDKANYDQAMREHGRQITRQDAHYAHQQQAYSDAMEAWRMQEAACKHGHQRACNAPTPDPANFY